MQCFELPMFKWFNRKHAQTPFNQLMQTVAACASNMFSYHPSESSLCHANNRRILCVWVEITFILALDSLFFDFPENREVRTDKAFRTSCAARSDEQEFYSSTKSATFCSKDIMDNLKLCRQ